MTWDCWDRYDPDQWEQRVERFAEPGGESALHPADDGNPRNLPCPTCGWPDRLTPKDVIRGYQCDACAVATERGLDIQLYSEYLAAHDEVHGQPEEVERGNHHDGG